MIKYLILLNNINLINEYFHYILLPDGIIKTNVIFPKYI